MTGDRSMPVPTNLTKDDQTLTAHSSGGQSTGEQGHGMDLRRPDRPCIPDGPAAAPRSGSVPVMCGLRAPPDGLSESADPIGSSRLTRTSCRYGSSGRVSRWCCGPVGPPFWGLPRRRANFLRRAAALRHRRGLSERRVVRNCQFCSRHFRRFFRLFHRQNLTHRAPTGRDETVGGNQQAFKEFRRARATTVRQPPENRWELATIGRSRSTPEPTYAAV
jgi:hypothetical protein